MKHGTRTAYERHGCRCDECRARKARDARRYRLRKGVDCYVSSESAIKHLKKLKSTPAVIAKVTGLSVSVICEITSRDKVRASTERKILSVTRGQIAEMFATTDRGYVPARSLLDLLEDLKVSGFAIYKLEEATGVNLRPRHKLARAQKARRIEQVYRQTGEAA